MSISRPACAILSATAVLLVGCQAASSPGLRSQGVMTGATVTQPHVAASRPVTFGSIMVCGSDDRPVTLNDVTLPTATGGLTVSAFAIRPDTGSGIGMADAALSSPLIGVDSVGPGLAQACAADGSEVLVEVTRAGSQDGCAPDGLDLHYSQGDQKGVLHVPLALGIGVGESPCG